tara:strand:+ start:216 stop:464 length:249 start_codon:yes stop_codon:yes gene_type:complete
MPKTKQWLVLNAVISWLYHYADQEDAVELTSQYEELKKELEQETINEQSKNTTVQKRGRPAKRKRTQKTTSTTVSKTTSKDA